MESFTVELRDVRVFARHGVMDQERRVGNDFSVSVSLRFDATGFIKASQTPQEKIQAPQRASGSAEDEAGLLGHTVNYAEVAEIVRREMAVPSALLESVALRIASALGASLRVPLLGGRVEIVKLTPPLGLKCAGAAVIYDF